GVVVENLSAAIAFFTELGLELQGEGTVAGGWVDRVVGLHGDRSRLAMMCTPDGHSQLELVAFDSPPARASDSHGPSNALGIRHLTFEVQKLDDLLDRLRRHGAELVGTVEQYENVY